MYVVMNVKTVSGRSSYHVVEGSECLDTAKKVFGNTRVIRIMLVTPDSQHALVHKENPYHVACGPQV